MKVCESVSIQKHIWLRLSIINSEDKCLSLPRSNPRLKLSVASARLVLGELPQFGMGALVLSSKASRINEHDMTSC